MARRRTKGTAAILAIFDRDPSRGKAFWWLYDAYDQIVERTDAKPIPWKHVLAEVRRRGLTNGNGQPVSSASALATTFARVAALKLREAEAKGERAKARRWPTNEPPPLATDGADYG